MNTLPGRAVARGLLAFALLVTGHHVQAAPTLIVSNGTLIGANDVSVGGVLFDVAFVDGTCAALFHGCDASSDFQFTDLASAQAAAQALLDTVFIDGPSRQFDSNPTLTRGCSDPDVCAAEIPWIASVPNNTTGTPAYTAASAANFADPSRDTIGAEYAVTTYDSGGPYGDFDVFALFSPGTPVTVPKPQLPALIGIGVLSALVAARRRRAPVPAAGMS